MAQQEQDALSVLRNLSRKQTIGGISVALILYIICKFFLLLFFFVCSLRFHSFQDIPFWWMEKTSNSKSSIKKIQKCRPSRVFSFLKVTELTHSSHYRQVSQTRGMAKRGIENLPWSEMSSIDGKHPGNDQSARFLSRAVCESALRVRFLCFINVGRSSFINNTRSYFSHQIWWCRSLFPWTDDGESFH